MLKRKIYDSLVAWKNRSCGKTALLIDGARRVGKVILQSSLQKMNTKAILLLILVISQKMCWRFLRMIQRILICFLQSLFFFMERHFRRENP